jgi:hypothetical protein
MNDPKAAPVESEAEYILSEGRKHDRNPKSVDDNGQHTQSLSLARAERIYQ